MSDLKTWRELMRPPEISNSNGMTVAVTPTFNGKVVTQFPSESAARFFVAAYHEVPTLLARIEELKNLSDPLLVDNLHADALRLEREKTVLTDRVKALEDQVAIEVNLRTKAQAKARKAVSLAAKALDQARDNEKLRAELAITRDMLTNEQKLRAAADKALEALETINEQVGPYIEKLEAALKELFGYYETAADDAGPIREEASRIQELRKLVTP